MNELPICLVTFTYITIFVFVGAVIDRPYRQNPEYKPYKAKHGKSTTWTSLEHQFCRDLNLSRVARPQYLTEIGVAQRYSGSVEVGVIEKVAEPKSACPSPKPIEGKIP